MPRSEEGKRKQYEYNLQYLKNNVVRKNVIFNRLNPEDQRIMEWLDSQPEGISPYMKRLILEDMARSATEKSSPDQ